MDVLIVFASADRAWADWTRAQLTGTELRVRSFPLDLDPELTDVASAVGQASHVIILLSENFQRAEGAERIVAEIIGNGTARLFVARIHATVPVPHQATVLNLTGDEATAIHELGRMLPLPERMGPTSDQDPDLTFVPLFPRHAPRICPSLTHNEHFTGRGRLLDGIRDRLTASATPAVQLLFGEAGRGKTTLAAEYAFRFRSDYDIVCWVSAETRATAQGELFDLAEALGIAGDDRAVRRLLDGLHRGDYSRRWLVIFDSADNPPEVAGLIPHGHGHVIITSRSQEWTGIAADITIDHVPVGAFELEEAKAYLRRRVPSVPEAEADKLAEHLGYSPLAMSQAADYLAATGSSVAAFIATVSDTASALMVALEQLRHEAPAAAKLFEVLTFLAAEPIPESVYLSTPLIDRLIKIDSRLTDRMQRSALVARIAELGLAHIEHPTRAITLHRYVQAAFRERQPAQAAAANRALAFKALAGANPGDPDRREHRPAYQALWLHLASPGLFDSSSPDVRQLIIDLVRYRYKLGDFHGAERQAREVLTHWSGPDDGSDLHRLELQRNQANALRRMGNPQAAYSLDERVAARFREALGPDDLRTLIAESGLAADLRALDKYAEALALDLHTVRAARQPGIGEDHEWALMFASNLATSYRVMGEAARAAEIDKETYERRRVVLGDDHAYTAYSAGSYGRDLRDLGEFEQSRSWLELAHEAYKRVLGGDHPDTLRAVKNLVVTLRRLALFEDAHRLSLETWQKANVKLGPEHPDSLLCLMALATTYSGRELHDRARRAGTDAVTKLTATLGRDHFYTLVARNNLAAIRLKEDPPVPQVAEVEEVLGALRHKLREGHWILSITAMNLANHHAEAGEVGDALFLDEETRERLTAEFGPNHPDAISASINLAMSYRHNGQPENAEETMRDAYHRARERFDPDHPRVRAAHAWQRWTYTYIDPPPLI